MINYFNFYKIFLFIILVFFVRTVNSSENIEFISYNESDTISDTLKINPTQTNNIIQDSEKSINNIKIDNPSIEKRVKEKIVADSMFLFDGDLMLVDVKKFSFKEITYTDPGEMDLYKIDRRKVHKIIYKSGLVEIINTIERDIPDSKDWKYILVTENPEEVENYIKLDKIKGQSREMSEDVTEGVMERSALVIVKKKAAQMDADIILITDKTVFRGYGEPPVMTIKATAYQID